MEEQSLGICLLVSLLGYVSTLPAPTTLPSTSPMRPEALSVQGPVKVPGNVKNGFVAKFIPNAVGLHVVLVEYNGVAVGGTLFYSKAYNTDDVTVDGEIKGGVGKTVTFAGKKENEEEPPK